WRVLESFGVTASAFAGHSYGELTALAAAGRLSETELFELSLLRGRLMAEAGRAGGDPGSMLAVKAAESDRRRALAGAGLDLTPANLSPPVRPVPSGATAEVDRAAKARQARRISCTRLAVAAAFHSPLVAGASRPFAEALRRARLRPGRPVFANTTAAV